MLPRVIVPLLLLAALPPCRGAAQSRLCVQQQVPFTRPPMARLADPSDSGSDSAVIALLGTWTLTCDRAAWSQAVAELRRRFGLAPRDTRLKTLLGIALARGPDVRVPATASYLYRPSLTGSNAEREARDLLADASVVSESAALELASLALATRDERTLAAAERAFSHLPLERETPDTWAARGAVALARGDAEATTKAALALRRTGDSRGDWIEGVQLLRAGPQGGVAYLRGLEQADPAALAFYVDDLLPVATNDELRLLTSAGSAHDLASLIRRAWEWRAAGSAISVAERIVIHQQRVKRALEAYPRRMGTVHSTSAVLPEQLAVPTAFSDRAAIYIRHGEPDRVIRAAVPGIEREAWVYSTLDRGRAVFEFERLAGGGDYVFAGPMPCDPFRFMFGEGGERGRALFERWAKIQASRASATERPLLFRGGVTDAAPVQNPDPSWWSRFERMYLDHGTAVALHDPARGLRPLRCVQVGQFAQAGRVKDALDMLDWLTLIQGQENWSARQALTLALETEDAGPRLARPLPALVASYAMRGRTGTELTAVVGVPGTQLEKSAQRAGEYHLALSLSAEDAVSHDVQRADTAIVIHREKPFGKDEIVRLLVSLPARSPANAVVRVGVHNQDATDQGQRITMVRSLPSYGSMLGMSDIVVADTSPGAWQRGQHAIAPRPGHQLQNGVPFAAYFEVYGAVQGDVLQTKFTIAPAGPSSLFGRLADLIAQKSAMVLSFDDVAQTDADGAARMFKTLGIDLVPGSYVLTIEVQNVRTHQVASSSTDVIVNR